MRKLTLAHLQAIEDCLNVADPCDEPAGDDNTPAQIHATAMEGLAILKAERTPGPSSYTVYARKGRDVDGSYLPDLYCGSYDTIEEARGCVEFDGLTSWEIWRGDTIVEESEDAETEGHVFRPGDEAALTQSLDNYLTRTPPHPDDGDMLQDWVDDVAEEGRRLENLRNAHREPGTAERIDNEGLTL